ncbi:hypothetical protein FDP22_21410 (plasmid) [Paroceanicella profunda]|uniref:Glycine-zipper-containing OmpA-like membrane domain-containing protein n=1 Tax=Paroceanicella profunda TaxID=2579971 RepID=A0A5B8G553_9RHOB|nr:glycine zipper family protein [Paroceanicella profunda]QDL94432.1 hypothetical protein FDP22_21410 [Paroceanicella profunda]
MKALLPVLAASLLSACAGMNDTQQRAASGTLIGAGSGAVIGAIAGDAGMGAVIGAGAGLLGGLVVDKVEKDKASAYEQGVRDGRATR